MNKHALDRSLMFIESWLEFCHGRSEIPGYVVTIAHEGTVLLNKAYGYADVGTKTTLTPQHIFRIASHSKTFTATALMQCVERNELRLDDYVVTYLPWLNDHRDVRWKKVSIRQLMSHSAGIIRDGLDADYWQLDRPFPDAKQLQQAVLDADLIIDTNTKIKYSNYGYSLLGLVLEEVSGQSYLEYVTEHISKPLGLRNTGPEYTSIIKDQLVTGYTRRDVDKQRLPVAQVVTKAMASATGFYATGEDLCRYFTAQFVGSDKLLSDESKKEMQRMQWHVKALGNDHTHEDYGLGMEITFANDRRTIGHGGGFPGQITKSMADPKDKLVVVVLTNCVDGPASWIAKGIYEIIDYYQNNTPETKPKHDMLQLEGRYMNLWAMTTIVVTGDKVVATYPDSWEPFSAVEGLEYVNETTLKVTDTTSFSSEGELVHFNVQDGKVQTVTYNGSTMWPEAVWLAKQRNKKIIGH